MVLWRVLLNLRVMNYSCHHIDMVMVDGLAQCETWRLTSFYETTLGLAKLCNYGSHTPHNMFLNN